MWRLPVPRLSEQGELPSQFRQRAWRARVCGLFLRAPTASGLAQGEPGGPGAALVSVLRTPGARALTAAADPAEPRSCSAPSPANEGPRWRRPLRTTSIHRPPALQGRAHGEAPARLSRIPPAVYERGMAERMATRRPRLALEGLCSLRRRVCAGTLGHHWEGTALLSPRTWMNSGLEGPGAR